MRVPNADETSRNGRYEAERPVIMEIRANTGFVMLGFVSAPFWLFLMDFKLIRGCSILESVLVTAQRLFVEPLFLAALAVLELLMVMSFLRVKHQRLALTGNSLVLQKGLFKPEKQVLPLAEVKAVYIKRDSYFIARKMGCAAVIIETLAGEKKTFNIMKQAAAFTDKVNYQLFRLRNNSD